MHYYSLGTGDGYLELKPGTIVPSYSSLSRLLLMSIINLICLLYILKPAGITVQ